MKANTLILFLSLCTLLCFTVQAQFSQPGELDTTFNFGQQHSFFADPANPVPGAGANSAIYTTLLQPDGKILIGGVFGSYNGTLGQLIARLSPNGSQDASFNPGAGPNGEVYSLALQPDGKLLIGGDFTSYNGNPRNGIVRLNSDGSLDTTFSIGSGVLGGGIYPSVRSIALQPDGKVVVGGDFTSYNGTSRNYIARLNLDGRLDSTFNPGTGANNIVWSLALQPDGKILIGGDFNFYNGTFRNRIARLNADGNLDTSFNPGVGADFTIYSLVLQPSGKVLIGGSFTSYNGTPHNRISRLNANGSLDATFNPGTGVNSTIFSLALQPDGKVLIGGAFTNCNGTPRNRIARLNANGSLDSTFNPGTGAGGWVRSLALQPDGKILIGGGFTTFNGMPRNRIVRLNADASLDATFNPVTGANNFVGDLLIQPDGKVVIGGGFTSYNGIARNGIARLNVDGSLDTTFNPGTGANGGVSSLALQPDGKLLIGGGFTGYNGTPRNRIARLNADGSLDATFNPGTGASSSVWSLFLQPDGKVMVGGDFTTYNGTSRNRIARLNANGSLDTTFNPGIGVSGGSTPYVGSIALQQDGRVLIGGEFTSYNGTSRNRIARLNANGSLDTTFNPGAGASSIVQSLALQPDGKVLIGGDFTSYNGTSHNLIARLISNGSLDTTFNIGTGVIGVGMNARVSSVALQPDGKALIVGDFTSYNGTSRRRIARLNADGSLDATFNPGTGASSFVSSLALQPDGKILIGGDFTTYYGIYRPRLARVLSTGAVTGWSDEGFITEQEFSIYPVPFSSQFTIQTEAPFRYEIMDLKGLVHLSGISESTEATCHSENLAIGMYLVKITVNGKSHVRKVVRE